MMLELTADSFVAAVERGTVLVGFYARGCAPWRAFCPIYEAAAYRHPGVVFATVDVGREPELASRCAIDTIPTLMAFRNGALVFARAGFEIAESLDGLVHRLRRMRARHGSE